MDADDSIKKDKAKLGKLLHFCYYCEQIIKMKDSFMNEEELTILLK